MIQTKTKSISKTNYNAEIAALAKASFFIETTIDETGNLIACKYDDTTLSASEKQAVQNYLAGKGLS